MISNGLIKIDLISKNDLTFAYRLTAQGNGRGAQGFFECVDLLFKVHAS